MTSQTSEPLLHDLSLIGLGLAAKGDEAGASVIMRACNTIERLSSSEVTKEMVEAGRDAWCRDPCNADDEAVKRIYLAMHSAATSERKG